MGSHDSSSFDEKASADVKSAHDVTVTVAPTDEHAHHLAFRQAQVDEAAQLVAGQDFELDEAEALRIRKKIDWHILPLMFSMCTFFF